MVNEFLNILKTQGTTDSLKYPSMILGGTFALRTLYNWNKERRSILKKSSLKKAHGILFGKQKRKIVYSPTNSEGHIAVFGGSGLGKTSAILIPTLQSWTGTSFVIDISGDICKNIPDSGKLVYEPANVHTTPYNIFGAIDSLHTESERTQALEELAYLLMPEVPNMNETSLFFLQEGRKILTASLISSYAQGMDFIPICEKIVTSNWKELFQMIDNSRNAKASAYITSFVGANEVTTAGCKQSCDSALKLFALNDIVKRTIRRPNQKERAFSPETLENQSVYILIEDSKLELYAPLLHIITAQTLDFLSNRTSDSGRTILLALDEFASLGKLNITPALRKLRKKHVRIMMLTQSMADIDLIYGKAERSAMMNNYNYKIVLGASDTETQEYFAKLIGYKNVTKNSTSKNGKHITYTQSEMKDYAIEPSSLAHLKNELILLHPEGFSKLKKHFYYKKF